ncbi:uncharacterized protein LOC111715262 [Eurytemora carolleeae]|uniref:uncharacterized protein LOC111715262 n=1 Tax=Eurytemora carolleeae TaxID=1294199 RepID=UPI000C758859|nr:uncharacterized protein LOC111715262 [Eurytemora carolleeae]|eukprot:XP_023346339.1 uncharacterized protein LOC111715262 [Eurytemora affinis]
MSSAGLISHFLDLLLGSEIKLKQLKLKFCTDPLVEAWARFVQGHQEALEEEPRLVNQLLINQPKNSVIFKAFISSNQSFNKNSKLLEWVNRSVEEREDRLVSRKQEKSPTVILLRDTILFLGYSDGIISVLDSQTFRLDIRFIYVYDMVSVLQWE